jgi:predicted HTH domain antitoxin
VNHTGIQRKINYDLHMTVEVQDELLRGVKVTPERLRLEAAIGLYASGDLSLGQASGIAQVSQSEFLHALGRHGVSVNYDVAEFEEDLQTLKNLGRLK